jgi:hypothetical protein
VRQAPSLDLVRRAVEVDAAYTLARMRVLERLAANPIGIGNQCIKNVIAFLEEPAVALVQSGGRASRWPSRHG